MQMPASPARKGTSRTFSVAGFGGSGANRLAEAHAQLPGLKALQLQACVEASYDSASNQICFTAPIYGHHCVTSPIQIPFGGDLKACIQTCGSLLPTGVKATIYLNNNPIFTVTIFGFC